MSSLLTSVKSALVTGEPSKFCSHAPDGGHFFEIHDGRRVRRNTLQFLDDQFLVAVVRLLQNVVVAEILILLHIDDLPGSHIGVDKFGMFVRRPKTEQASPRVAHNEYFLPLEAVTKIVHDFERVLPHLRHIHGSAEKLLLVIRCVGLPCSSLIPLHHSEVFLPRILKGTCKGHESNAGSASEQCSVKARSPHEGKNRSRETRNGRRADGFVTLRPNTMGLL